MLKNDSSKYGGKEDITRVALRSITEYQKKIADRAST